MCHLGSRADDEFVGARVTSPVLIGRRDELRVLDGVLDRAAVGEFAVAVIGGEAGIGKTRLSMLAGERARRQGFTVLIGGCLDIGESTVPYAPLLEALRQLWAELDGDALTEVLGPASAELVECRCLVLVFVVGWCLADLPFLLPGWMCHGLADEAAGYVDGR